MFPLQLGKNLALTDVANQMQALVPALARKVYGANSECSLYGSYLGFFLPDQDSFVLDILIIATLKHVEVNFLTVLCDY